MSSRALVVESRLYIGSVRNLCEHLTRTNELRKFVQLLDRLAPPIALAKQAQIVVRLELECEM